MIPLREDAVKTFFLGVEVYAFGLYVALGLALALIVLAVLLKKHGFIPGTAALTGTLALAIGLCVARLFFGLMDGSLGQIMPLWAMAQLPSGGYSMMGAMLGACMGAVAAAAITKQNGARLLDHLSVSLMLFVACERLGEGYIPDFGVSRTLTDDLLNNTFLATDGCLNTYLLESLIALVLAIVLLRDLGMKRRGGDTFLKFLLLFGATQVLMESLRYDRHMTVRAFVRLEMIMAMMLLGTAVILLAVRNLKTRRGLALAGLISIPLTVGLGVLIEFMIDRSTVSHYLLYAAFIAVLAVPAYLGLRLRREDASGKA